MMRSITILAIAALVAAVLGFWGILGAFTASMIVLFWVALALLVTTMLVAALGGGGEAYR
jgi:uncharacterized membrane protein YtjA (UPF0391 family)